MPKIYVMFSSRPKLLSEVIRNFIERQPDMEVAGEVIDPIELIFALRATPVDVVIITPHKVNGDPRICSQLLKEHPQLKILILTLKSETLYIYQSRSCRKRIERPSEQTILDVIHEPLQPAHG
jgi:DNA-binding NarL/FixJ family response regulator